MVKPILFLDVDGVILDLNEKVLARHNADHGCSVCADDIDNWDYSPAIADSRHIIEYFNEPGFFAGLTPLPGAIDAIRRLSKQYDIILITDTPVVSRSHRLVWVSEALPFINGVLFTRHKDRHQGYILVDDAPHNIDQHNATHRIVFDKPYNQQTRRATHRVMSWAELEPLLFSLLKEYDHDQ